MGYWLRKNYLVTKWVLTPFLLILTTQYLITIYYTKSDTYDTQTDTTIHRNEFLSSRAVLFPVNKNYYPDHANDIKIQTTDDSKPLLATSRQTDSTLIIPINKTAASTVKIPRANTTRKPLATTKKLLASTIKKSIHNAPKKPLPNMSAKLKAIGESKYLVAKENSNKLILAWTALHSRKPLWGITKWSFRHCKYSNCEVTGNRSRLNEADLLIFRIRELKRNATAIPYRAFVQPLDLSDMPSHHKTGQLWMDINEESPVYTHADEEVAGLNGVFNLSSNYLLNSDFPVSYIPEVKLKKDTTSNKKSIDYSLGKSKMALWFVSHCGAASGRDEYVRELQKHNITVDIFGKCSGLSDGCTRGNHTCYTEVRQKYKFYLAFENSICNEYITEKFWSALTSDSYNIPIALGANIKEYTHFSPPHSFLHTRNFTSVKSLATYMRRVATDTNLFNSYHRWRESYEILPRAADETLHCYMCRQANEKKDGKQEYKNLSKYWSRKHNCELHPEPIK